MSFRNIKFGGLQVVCTLRSAVIENKNGGEWAIFTVETNHPLAKVMQVGIRVDPGDDWIKLIQQQQHLDAIHFNVAQQLRDTLPKVLNIPSNYIVEPDVTNWEEAFVNVYGKHLLPIASTEEENDSKGEEEKPKPRNGRKTQA